MRIDAGTLAAEKFVGVSERLVGAATVAHELHGSASECGRNLARRRHRIGIVSYQVRFTEPRRDDRAAEPHHAVVGMLAENFLDRGERGLGIVAFKFFEMIARIARIGDLLGMQLARDVGHYVFAAEPACAIEQAAGIGPAASGRREHLP